MGMAFIGGGWSRTEQNFNTTVAQTASSLLALAVGALIVPTAFHLASNTDGDKGVVELSRGTAVILLIVYGFYLYFQLNSHKDIYNAESEKVAKKEKEERSVANIVNSTTSPALREQAAQHARNSGQMPEDEDDDEEEPDLTKWAALILLVASTVLVAICSECLVSSIDYLVDNGPLGRVFVGLILLPIVGNAAEHATAVRASTSPNGGVPC